MQIQEKLKNYREELVNNAGYNLSNNNVRSCVRYGSIENLKYAVDNKLDLSNDNVRYSIENASIENLKYAVENKLDLSNDDVYYCVRYGNIEFIKMEFSLTNN